MVPIICRATIGVVGNGDHNLINIGKLVESVTWYQTYSPRFRYEPE